MGAMLVERRQSAPRRRMLKSGKIILGKHRVPYAVRNLSENGACLKVQTTVGISSSIRFHNRGRARQDMQDDLRDETQIGVMFIEGSTVSSDSQ
jgi:hypothetical protein